ncbi:hypothetical protein [Acinetobacter bereziniae]|uniref:hypothetical protein n=1 Tax=Acinetobacter bereziniae TaxID=106648 RepID=UPI0012503932|nr:hypothetical protein [Acinetobacter bereziniae]MBJ8450196.1 hypothetical protein [Acinetobacter bereziniae]MBJ8454769.1 hypothetical protein [Acinetobacter bereziniae]MBJ9904542.1 hypothetical protein [Acinetobacter bereziniae]MCU4321374.1 hypothetical protein [Acinetobacter bereziniae]MCU4600280.1 hypothetical protein [Acinetobacter bereziniae]
MFRKGIVIFYDEKSAKGLIELKNDHQQVVFKLEDFSNQTVLPQLGERIKCVVLEQNGEVLAKFIVRLDHKNYVTDPNRSLPIQHLYEENVYENVRKARKAHKKRRVIEDEQLSDNVQSLTRPALQAQTMQMSEDKKLDVVVQDICSPENKTQEQHSQDKQLQDYASTRSYQAEDKSSLIDPNLINADKDIAEAISEIVLFDTVQISKTEPSLAQIQTDNRAAQKNISLHCESEERAILHEKQQHLGDSKREAVVNLQTQTVVLTHPVEHRILEKNMHLNVLQQFFQNIKIQFFYSKRKQTKKKTASEPAIRLNPWIVIIGIILFIGVNCVMYAMDRYKQYKIESVIKLQQYQQQQKDAIKQQKREAYSR